MPRSIQSNLLIVFFLSLFLLSCQDQKNEHSASAEVPELPENPFFGKTDVSAYTPEVRESMKELYEYKFGLFVHWGPYAQLEGIWDGEKVSAEWIMRRAFIPVKDYEREAAGKFLPEKFNAGEWVDVAENAGMKFIVITAKHHDGFAMYNSSHPYNLVDFAGYGRDILKELSEACAGRDMKLGFYYSQSQDWHEKGASGNHWDFGSVQKPQDEFDAYFQEKAIPQVEELTSNYGDIFMIWFDTPAQMTDESCQEMMDVVKTNQPGALVNSRLGNGFGHFDVAIDNGKTPSVSKATWLPDLKIPWQTHESVTTGGWGYTSYGGENDRSEEYTEFIYSLCRIVSNGGVYLLNVAPRPDGTIPESQVNSITAIGDWLAVNGEAIYNADPSPLKFPPYAITSKPGKVYLHLKELEENTAHLEGLLSRVKKAYCLADESQQALDFKQKKAHLSVLVPEELQQPRITVVVLEIEDEEARVVNELLQQEEDGSILLPAAKCEYVHRRISYDYENKTTRHWGGSTHQGLVWTVNISEPGSYKVLSEDNGSDKLSFEIKTPTDVLEVFPGGEVGEISKKSVGIIKIDQEGIVQITAYPKQTIGHFNDFRFKGLELIPITEEDPDLYLSDGSKFSPKDYYPDFSWNTTPMYYMFGDTKRLLTPEEVEFIAARTDYLCIEKSHGYDPLGAAELGAKHEAAAFKKINPNIKVLFYFNSAWAWPFTSYNKDFRPERIDNHPELKKFLIVDSETGKPELEPRRKTYRFDVLNPEFRHWWIETVATGVEESGCDGAFIDQMHGFFFLRENRKEEALKAQGELISGLKERLGADKIVLGNNTTDDIARYAYPAIDANMFEHYNKDLLSKEMLLSDWDDMLRLARDGKMAIFRIGVEQDPLRESYESQDESLSHEEKMARLAKERIEYHLACFLIGAQPYSYFQYGWGWTLSSGSLYDYPELHKPLGAPKGGYERTSPDAWEFTREFEHAHVWVDTEKGQGKITWN